MYQSDVPQVQQKFNNLEVLKMTVVEAIAMDGRSRRALVTFKNVQVEVKERLGTGGRGTQAWNRIYT